MELENDPILSIGQLGHFEWYCRMYALLKLAAFLPVQYYNTNSWSVFVQVLWATGSSCEILLAYWIIPRAGWRVLVLVSALPMVVTLLLSCVWWIQSSVVYCHMLLNDFFVQRELISLNYDVLNVTIRPIVLQQC